MSGNGMGQPATEGATAQPIPANPLVSDLERIAVRALSLRDALAVLSDEVDREALFTSDSNPRLRAWADSLNSLFENADEIYSDVDYLIGAAE